MAKAGLPLLPGSVDPLDADEAAELAAEIGFPVIIKAVAGGGGRGMAVVRDPDAFTEEFHRTQANAQMLFADGRVYVEKYLEHARHVEVQVLADTQGQAIHLGARDCTVQRRHQKLIEETPAPGVSPGLADRLAEAAVAGAKAAGFTGAGTFEFLVSGEEFAFIEVNSRIQVEHPVTEAVTGIDLVREQLWVAAGRPLSFRQEDVHPRGVAVECRINAEDPERDFVPCAGELAEFVPPGGPFVRVDTHAYTGYRVPPDYDSLLAKVIAWGPDREQAIARMERALSEFRIEGRGIRTTKELLRAVLAEPAFREGTHTTSLLAEDLAGNGAGNGAGDGVPRSAAPRP
jgi:acetyl-CoA carboxylase biotin carboxylase subunit